MGNVYLTQVACCRVSSSSSFFSFFFIFSFSSRSMEVIRCSLRPREKSLNTGRQFSCRCMYDKKSKVTLRVIQAAFKWFWLWRPWGRSRSPSVTATNSLPLTFVHTGQWQILLLESPMSSHVVSSAWPEPNDDCCLREQFRFKNLWKPFKFITKQRCQVTFFLTLCGPRRPSTLAAWQLVWWHTPGWPTPGQTPWPCCTSGLPSSSLTYEFTNKGSETHIQHKQK